MKVIIAGSRNLGSWSQVTAAIVTSGFEQEMSEIVSGGARGVDRMGEHFASLYKIPLKVFPADWNKNGKAAGPIRNAEMAKYADALIAVWDGESRGTKNMIDEMEKLDKPVHVYQIETVYDEDDQPSLRTKGSTSLYKPVALNTADEEEREYEFGDAGKLAGHRLQDKKERKRKRAWRKSL